MSDDLNSALEQARAALRAETHKAAVPPVVTGAEQNVAVPNVAINDTLVAAGAMANDGAAEVGPEPAPDPLQDVWAASTEKVAITEEERELFLDALVRNSRFELPFTLFQGRIRGRIQSRTTAESRAINVYIVRQLNTQALTSGVEYQDTVRAALLAAQVVECNGVVYPGMGPVTGLYATSKPSGVEEPAWIPAMKTWLECPSEGLVVALYEELRVFEKKYWTLVAEARNQNF